MASIQDVTYYNYIIIINKQANCVLVSSVILPLYDELDTSLHLWLTARGDCYKTEAIAEW